MKKQITSFLLILSYNFIIGQVSGNINYQNQVVYSDQNINVHFTSKDILVNVKGLANVKADTYVAIFHLSQIGKTTEEVNSLMDSRINQAISKINLMQNITTYVDMISFVPMYEYEVEKKLFSKKTYNEIPTGFELKKNIHIQYTDADQLNQIISILSKLEIYDLVRVDYFSSKIESIKKELRKKSKDILQEKIENYQSLLNKNLDSLNKNIVEGFKIVLPIEKYESYQSYQSASLNLKKSHQINDISKSTTLYYQPIINKEFDFVINPTILEPVIQVMYEVKLQINNTATTKNNKEYFIISPNGEIKSLNIK